MDQRYENKAENVVFVEPVSVEDRPLPLRWRAWEAVRRGAFGAYTKIRRSGALRTAAWLAVLLLALAASPVLALFVLGRRPRRAAGAAY